MKEELINKAYEIAKERYAAVGVDTEKVMETMQNFHLSLHCWGSKETVSMEVLISWRIAAISLTSPLAFACNIMLPIAVPSLGPAITGTPTALQVNWFNRLFREPPPIMCSFSMGNGAICCK